MQAGFRCTLLLVLLAVGATCGAQIYSGKMLGRLRKPPTVAVDDNFMNLLLSRPGMPERLRANFTKENVAAYFDMSTMLDDASFDIKTTVDAVHHGLSHSMPAGTKPEHAGRYQDVQGGPGKNLTVDPAVIILIGKTIWDMIKDGHSTVDTTSDYGGAIPKGATWDQLSHWQDRYWNDPVPQMRYFWHNLFGDQVLMRWYWTWKYHGAYQNKGAYVTMGTAIPSKIEVSWGYHLNARVTVSDPINYGDQNYPIAGVTFQLTIDVNNWRGSSERVVHIATLKGDGSGTTL